MAALTVVIGAGPYGLSAAAHLRAAGVPTLTFGRPMEFWAHMPRGLFLKSPWSASSLSDPSGSSSLDAYVRAQATEPVEPIPLPLFLDYAAWFRARHVPEIDETYVSRLRRVSRGFALELEDGRELEAERVVIAAGIRRFARVPAFAAELPASLVSHTIEHGDFADFAGQRVLVVGTGQSALESAALLAEAGAGVELVCRGPVNWVHRRFYNAPRPIRLLFYPPTDVGPPGINWVVAYPMVVRRLPARARSAMFRRATRPAGAKWLRPRFEGAVTTTPNRGIRRVTPTGAGLAVELSDGSTREVDHLLLGTGFKPDLGRLPFLSEPLRHGIEQANGLPVLNRWFESSVPNLHFIGGVAGYSFGPLCNFVTGARVPAQQIAARARRGS